MPNYHLYHVVKFYVCYFFSYSHENILEHYAHVSIYSTRNIASSKIVQTQMIVQTMTNANYVYEIVEAIKIK